MRCETILLFVSAFFIAGCGSRQEPDPSTPPMAALIAGVADKMEALIKTGANIYERRGIHRVSGMAFEGDNPEYNETALIRVCRLEA